MLSRPQYVNITPTSFPKSYVTEVNRRNISHTTEQQSPRNIQTVVLCSVVIHHHDDVIKWTLFFTLLAIYAGNSWSPVNSPHKGQWQGALVFALICVWINGWVNNREADNLARYDVIVMMLDSCGFVGSMNPCPPGLFHYVIITLIRV